MERYITIVGETIEYETPSRPVAAFLARVVDAAHDPRVSESEMIDLVYGSENPLLRQDVIPGHGLVTRETFANPVYHVMLDLLGRKRVQLGTLDPERARDEYTVTITEAANRLGVHPSAIRQAIHAKRLDAMKRGHLYLIRPSALESFQLSRRGPKPDPALDVVAGNDDGRSLRIKVLGGELQVGAREGHRVSGTIRAFKVVGVISGGAGRHRFFLLEPSETSDELAFGPFHIRGRFRVAARENNPRAAREAWKKFEGKVE